ncbi:MAG: hypothetical protein HY834_03620 [Devosia nanyangense]|uniref:DUF7670 domain-containing protein n=1 Tax=Devosia nanyangense TaxID=1228055 RepID=A0A933NXV9_9HYPH|nr:hypothetical protein [Devosia nanyangense]
MSRALIIAARLVAILGICFISLFALDVFGSGLSLAEFGVGLVMHLLPSFALIAVLVLAWRWPVAGGLVYLVIALLPFALLGNSFWVNVMLGAPFALAGLLFLAASLIPEVMPPPQSSRSGSP